MREEHDVTPQNLFPGAVGFEEHFDLDEDDDADVGNILSFESLRKAFATLESAESELGQTIPEIKLSAGKEPEASELPDYEIEDVSELEHDAPVQNPDAPVSVAARLETVVEAILFVGNRESRPIPAEHIAAKLRNVCAEEVDQTVASLNTAYAKRNCPYTIIFDSGGYQMILRPEFESVRSNFYGKVREARLSQQAIDTLAIVACRQPTTAEEIQKLRRQSSSAILNQLVRRNLLRITRTVQDKKSIVHYHTTERFLELLRIQSLDDIQAMLRER
ncbi:MAG: SMC-Scp complex subunit ScpB [Planctomycetaceae bacterium]|nr:SMC-Scp complex subunit ScpB [Planctomycetaceae bacterium]